MPVISNNNKIKIKLKHIYKYTTVFHSIKYDPNPYG